MLIEKRHDVLAGEVLSDVLCNTFTTINFFRKLLRDIYFCQELTSNKCT